PCTIIHYMLELSRAVSSAIEQMRVLGAPEDVAEARLLMYWSARAVLKNALTIIGLEPLTCM
ncbi:hypothetical protein GGI10_006213, partial [Coemansia sp. RSA 2530]